MNLNPVANGNKTQSGAMGTLAVGLTAGIYAVLKQLGIDNAEIASLIASAAINGGLLVWGAIHKAIKARKAK